MTINMTFTSFEEIVEFARKMAAGQAVPVKFGYLNHKK